MGKNNLEITYDQEKESFLLLITTDDKTVPFTLSDQQALLLADYLQSHLIYKTTRERIEVLKNLRLQLQHENLSDTDIAIPMHSSSSQVNVKRTAEVFIGLPQEEIDIFTIEKFQNACGEFMEALGFELKTEDEPIYGSFFQRLQFLSKSKRTNEEIDDIYQKGKRALEYKYLNVPAADATSQLSQAASQLISAVKDIDEAVVRLGSILLVKTSKEGKSQIIIETVSHELASSFDNNPNLLKNPNAVYELLVGERKKQNNVDEGEGSLV
jgi:hypothetical protein